MNGPSKKKTSLAPAFMGWGGTWGTREPAGVGIDEPGPGSVGIHYLDDSKHLLEPDLYCACVGVPPGAACTERGKGWEVSKAAKQLSNKQLADCLDRGPRVQTKSAPKGTLKGSINGRDGRRYEHLGLWRPISPGWPYSFLCLLLALRPSTE